MQKQLLAGLIFGFLTCAIGAEEAKVEQRQTIFKKVEKGTESLEILIDHGAMSDVVVKADALSKQIAQLVNLFPEDTRGKGRSSSKIWKNWDDFSARLSRFESAYVQMSNAASNEDSKRVKQAFKLADSSCRSCHMKYRSLW
ncbi:MULTISPECIES: c-type cytochrome [unclassified Marinomonas]|uniref:c-type cytochrome n=1 Tax=unclassified Marinomonas TaxID=196814 RepID=UPI0007AFC237|nr:MULTISPECIES: cytochrome c [unclassified Marinomonas]